MQKKSFYVQNFILAPSQFFCKSVFVFFNYSFFFFGSVGKQSEKTSSNHVVMMKHRLPKLASSGMRKDKRAAAASRVGTALVVKDNANEWRMTSTH